MIASQICRAINSLRRKYATPIFFHFREKLQHFATDYVFFTNIFFKVANPFFKSSKRSFEQRTELQGECRKRKILELCVPYCVWQTQKKHKEDLHVIWIFSDYFDYLNFHLLTSLFSASANRYASANSSISEIRVGSFLSTWISQSFIYLYAHNSQLTPSLWRW